MTKQEDHLPTFNIIYAITICLLTFCILLLSFPVPGGVAWLEGDGEAETCRILSLPSYDYMNCKERDTVYKTGTYRVDKQNILED